MGLMWFCLGSLVILALWGLFTWNSRRQKRFSILSWVALLAILFVSLFTIAWAVSSMLENEPQAAGMGLLIFGAITLLLIALTRRLLKRDTNT